VDVPSIPFNQVNGILHKFLFSSLAKVQRPML
jgi:hypothetical protein